LWEMGSGNHWHWDRLNNLAGLVPITFTLAEGINTIKVRMREDGTKLDKLLLTNDISGFTPGGKGYAEHHWVEAENADSIVEPLEVTNDQDASEGKFVYSPINTGNQYTPSSIMALYTVTISQKGVYVFVVEDTSNGEGTIHRRDISIGELTGEGIEIYF